MAPAATTLDPFSAIAEPKRRQVLTLLAKREMPVGGLVEGLGWPQPQVSKHLKVLLTVGLVDVRQEGRQRVYSVNGRMLKSIHDWIATFESLWQQHVDRIKERAELKAKQRLDAQRD